MRYSALLQNKDWAVGVYCIGIGMRHSILQFGVLGGGRWIQCLILVVGRKPKKAGALISRNTQLPPRNREPIHCLKYTHNISSSTKK